MLSAASTMVERCGTVPATPEEARAMPWFLPFLIFGARILDVSIGTLRVMFTVSGSRWIAAGLGFVELTIWALAVGGLVTNLTNPFVLVAYAGGFAAGTLVGLTIEDRMALGFRSVQVVNADPTVDLSSALRAEGYRVTELQGEGRSGPVEVILVVIRRRQLNALRRLITEVSPQAFMTVERADRPAGGVFGALGRRRAWWRFGPFK
jgi:uncharacterized protein YebE (UPF0316 family)